jgi:RNA polymerase sigma factor (sigma-70 family)
MNYSELAMEIMEHDINYWCSRYWIPGYDKEDLEQECRLALWKAVQKFKTDQGVYLRTWANMVIKNRLKELLRASHYDCRAVSHQVFKQIDNIYAPDFDLEGVLSILLENNMTLDDLS